MVENIVGMLTPRRFATYMKEAGFDRDIALELYIWNARIGGAFHLSIQATEVALRNRISRTLATVYGPNWWRDQNYLTITDDYRKTDIATVEKRIRDRCYRLDTDQVVAELSFGFWVGMLQGQYNQGIWGAHLNTAFPAMPVGTTRSAIHQSVKEISHFRNRISHHEPLVKANLSQKHSDVLKLLSWLCPSTANWIRKHSEVPALLRQKPKARTTR